MSSNKPTLSTGSVLTGQCCTVLCCTIRQTAGCFYLHFQAVANTPPSRPMEGAGTDGTLGSTGGGQDGINHTRNGRGFPQNGMSPMIAGRGCGRGHGRIQDTGHFLDGGCGHFGVLLLLLFRHTTTTTIGGNLATGTKRRTPPGRRGGLEVPVVTDIQRGGGYRNTLTRSRRTRSTGTTDAHRPRRCSPSAMPA